MIGVNNLASSWLYRAIWKMVEPSVSKYLDSVENKIKQDSNSQKFSDQNTKSHYTNDDNQSKDRNH